MGYRTHRCWAEAVLVHVQAAATPVVRGAMDGSVLGCVVGGYLVWELKRRRCCSCICKLPLQHLWYKEPWMVVCLGVWMGTI
eukprot:1159975-Pelagomonas_calceolata.AAC.3